MIQAQDITKAYGSLQVLRGVGLSVAKGEVVSIVGPSGAGKTTLLQILGTLARPTAGQEVVNRPDVDPLSQQQLAHFRCRNIRIVFHDPELLPEFTALENVAIPALIDGQSRRQANKRAEELIEYLGLSDRRGHKPAELSGGERQRIAVARALTNRPAVVLADEPSGALDTQNKQELHQLFFDLRQQLGQTFVIVTHDMELAQAADRMIRLRDGLVEE